MLEIEVQGAEMFNEETNEFFESKSGTLYLEHSLISISKWESKWKKPFMVKSPEKTSEEILDYIKCMTINKNVDPEVYLGLNAEHLRKINQYIDDAMTATTFPEDHSAPSREIMTSELIYYWMFKAGIPMECEKWHINRLITLIRVFGIKDAPRRKMSKGEIMARNRELNAQRRKKYNTRG